MNRMDDPGQKKIFLTSLALAAAFVTLAGILTAAHITLPPCLFFRLTGLYCPGCGGLCSVQPARALYKGKTFSPARHGIP